MKLKLWLAEVVVLTFGIMACSWLSGCTVGSADSVIPSSSGNFSGNYVGAGSNGVLVTQNTGNPVTSLMLTQYGNQLQAVDNNGILFHGTLGDVSGGSSSSSNTTSSSTSTSASFMLQGSTTAGNSVVISGTLSANGTTATMRGVWAEPSLYGSIYGAATISPITPPTPGPTTMTISPSSATLSTIGQTVTFTASGGTSPYTWSLANITNGTISANTGTSVTYTRTASGNNQVSLTDSVGNNASAPVSQP